MKAEINKDGLLILSSDSKEESEVIYRWYQKNKARIVIPKKRDELSFLRFDALDIAVIYEPLIKE